MIPGNWWNIIAQCSGIPHNAHLSLRVIPQPGSHEFGLRLRGSNAFDTGYQLHFTPRDNAVYLKRQCIGGVDGLDHPFVLEIALRDDIIDVCIAGSRTLIDRFPERRGASCCCTRRIRWSRSRWSKSLHCHKAKRRLHRTTVDAAAHAHEPTVVTNTLASSLGGQGQYQFLQQCSAVPPLPTFDPMQRLQMHLEKSCFGRCIHVVPGWQKSQ